MKPQQFFPIAIIATVVYFIVMVVLIVQMPSDYFVRGKRAKKRKKLSLFAKIIKNIVGIVLIIIGFAMLVLPGQGLLTIAMGLFFVDFPGKRKLELRLIRKPAVHEGLNWVRSLANKPPIEVI